MLPPFTLKRLEKEDRSDFECGKDDLDRYFWTQISQDMHRQITTAFIAWHNTTDTIAGFYTLCAAHVPFTDLDEDWCNKLPHYPSLPAVLIGRLAINHRFKGQGPGSALVAGAAARTIRSDIAAHFQFADALDEDAFLFYQHHGVRRVPGDGNRLFIPLSTLGNLLAG